MCSGIDPEANFAVIEQAAHEAKAVGAVMLFTPEMSLLLDRNRQRAAEHIMP
ncbi:MAG: nitrilase, partial [Erythrobacter sp.]|nr:nitrilase [Erythrobacter sp.]